MTRRASAPGVRLHRDGRVSFTDANGVRQHRRVAWALSDDELAYVESLPGGMRVRWWVLRECSRAVWRAPGAPQPERRYSCEAFARDAAARISEWWAERGSSGPVYRVVERRHGDLP